MKNKKLILGLDCGGTNMKMALLNSDGKMLSSGLEPVSYKESPDKVIQTISKVLKAFLKKSNVLETQIQGVGAGMAGDVDQTTGKIRFSPNLGWKNVEFGKKFKKEFGAPVFIDNDANCAALGAYDLDAKRDCKNLICLTLGTGVGGGIIIDGKLYRGASGGAGELGHMTIAYQGAPCKCGNAGCLESFVGAWGLIQTAEAGLKKNRSPILKKLVAENGNGKCSPRILAQAAKSGDRFSQELWNNAGTHLGFGLANLVNIFNPDRIVLCGGVSKAGALILSPALQTLKQRAFASSVKKVKVTISAYDEKLGVVGAGLLVQQGSL